MFIVQWEETVGRDEEVIGDGEIASNCHESFSHVILCIVLQSSKIDVTDVLAAMGALPAGFRPSFLHHLETKSDKYSLKHTILPARTKSNLTYRDLVWDSSTGGVSTLLWRTLCGTLQPVLWVPCVGPCNRWCEYLVWALRIVVLVYCSEGPCMGPVICGVSIMLWAYTLSNAIVFHDSLRLVVVMTIFFGHHVIVVLGSPSIDSNPPYMQLVEVQSNPPSWHRGGSAQSPCPLRLVWWSKC